MFCYGTQPPKTNNWNTQNSENFLYFLSVFQKYLCIFKQFFLTKMFLIYCKCSLFECFQGLHSGAYPPTCPSPVAIERDS